MSVARWPMIPPELDDVLDLPELREEWRRRAQFELSGGRGAARIVLEVNFKDGQPVSFATGGDPADKIRFRKT